MFFPLSVPRRLLIINFLPQTSVEYLPVTSPCFISACFPTLASSIYFNNSLAILTRMASFPAEKQHTFFDLFFMFLLSAFTNYNICFLLSIFIHSSSRLNVFFVFFPPLTKNYPLRFHFHLLH